MYFHENITSNINRSESSFAWALQLRWPDAMTSQRGMKDMYLHKGKPC